MSKSGLGKAIQNKLQKKHRAAVGNKAPIFFQQTEENEAQIKKLKMKSIIQQNSLSQFLQTAELSQKDFKANRDIKFREIKEEIKYKKVIMLDNKLVTLEDDIDQSKLKGLQMPRRPKWKQIEKKDDLNKAEADAYLEWRRNLANLQQNNADIKITPYEKNIQVWKQLWRVTQRADLMVQIVDGRDPLFFRCQDLVQYINEVNPDKRSLLLINKSDLVPEEVRVRWNNYLNEHKIHHIFFSAKLAEKQNEDNLSQKIVSNQVVSEKQIIEQHFNKKEILNLQQLTSLFKQYAKLLKKDKIEIGLVGYPNVGKSSVINALLGQKKVAVASMPGKTKHFQTLYLSDNIVLCDCPGLVFPRISASHAYMVLNGLYPIDTIKSIVEPMTILTQRIPKPIIQETYALHWKQNELYDCETLMNKYSLLKGFFTGNGIPNQSIAAKNILKDYVNGILIYARNPPGLVGDEVMLNTNEKVEEKQVAEQGLNMKKKIKNVENDLDEQFFQIQKMQLMTTQQIIQSLTEDDILDLIQGKKMPGLKITKEMRSNMKHGLKRGEGVEVIKKKYLGGHSQEAKKLVKL